MRFELGINNCFAVKRWPIADEWAQIIATELELTLVQHSLDLSLQQDAWIAEAGEIRSACDVRGIRVDSVFTGLSAYSSNLMLGPVAAHRARGALYWEAGIRFAAAVGASSFGGHVGSLSRADADDPGRRGQLWAELQDRLVHLAGLAHRDGIRDLLVENMASDREPSRMDESGALLREADREHAGVRLCLDVGHQCAPGISGEEADPYAWLRRMGPRTRVVHLQQSDGEGDHHWPFTEEFNRRGRIRSDRVLEALVESGAEEMTLILEVIHPFEADDGRVLADLRESVDYWRGALSSYA